MYRQAETKECCLLKLNFIADLSRVKSRISAFARRRNPVIKLRILSCETRSKTEHLFFLSLEFALASIMRHRTRVRLQTSHASLDLRGITCYSLRSDYMRYVFIPNHKEITRAETDVLLSESFRGQLSIVYSISFVFYPLANITSSCS